MPARTELDRLVAARPALLDHTERVIDAAAEDVLRQQILSTPRPQTGRPRLAGPGHPNRSARPVAALAGATVVIVAAAGILAGADIWNRETGSQGGHPAPGVATRPHMLTAETLAYRTVAALTEAGRYGILYSRTVFAPGGLQSPGTSSISAGVIRVWTRGLRTREREYSASGSLIVDASAVLSHGLRIRRFVDYPGRTWQTDSIRADQVGQSPSIGVAVRSILGTDRSPARGIPSRTIAMVTVHGTKMFKVTLTWPRHSPGLQWLPLFTDAQFLPGPTKARTETIWINITSYLPVQVTITGQSGKVISTEAIAMLSPNQANLGELAPAPIPAGFRQTQPLAR